MVPQRVCGRLVVDRRSPKISRLQLQRIDTHIWNAHFRRLTVVLPCASPRIDHYEEAVVELIRKKQAHEPIKKGSFSSPKNVVNLMDALRRSAANDSSAKPKQPKKASKRIAGQREMLLPITGKKKDAKEATKPAARRKTG
jgi:hypothetical protein